MLTDALEIHFVNMFNFRRLKEKDIINNPLHRWLTFFSKETDEETIKKIIAMDTAIGKAQEKVAYVSRDAETLRLYNMRELALMDYVSGINHARREGMQEGMAIGEQKGMSIGKQEGMVIGEQKGMVIGKQEGMVIGEQKGIVIGKQEGIAIGKQEALSEYVFKLSGKGRSIEEISELTDLSVEEVKEVLNSRE
jgi:predicted transposase/invertase (TIGR01784 family)